MDLQQAYYELKFENAFLKAKGDAFQDFFEKLMGLAYKADFMACHPWGNRGDKKNDGFLKSERRLFQVYAPYEMTETKAIDKITEDFNGALEYWGSLFDKWVFAHNADDGLPPHVQKVLLDFEQDHPGVTIEPWCREELRSVFRLLSIDDLQSWFGFAPTSETKARLGFRDLQIVLENISQNPVKSNGPVKDVPPGKILANALSPAIEKLLKEGMSKVSLVEDFFSQWHDHTLGERISKSFRAKYDELKADYTPNTIFTELQAWSGGKERGVPEHELAVLTVMAYYFERCDIFEEPGSEKL